MNKRKTYVFIALVLALLVVAGLTAILTRNSIDEPDKPDPVETPEITESQQPEQTETPQPTETPKPVETPKPTETPEPTDIPAPLETKAPEELTREVSGSGSFKTDTGTNLNMIVDWSVKAKNDSEVLLKLDISLKSYSIGVGSRIGTIFVNGNPYYFTTDALDISNNKSTSTTLIHSETVTVNVAKGETATVPVSVDWVFNGSYNGKQLETITAANNIIING